MEEGMRALAAILLTLALLPLAPRNATGQDAGVQATTATPQAKDWKVVGGLPATLAMTPWQVALMDVNQPLLSGPICGGTAIADKWVLTAAHCFYDIPTCTVRFTASRIWVLHGTTDLGTQTPKLASVNRIHLPTKTFDCKTFVADIALLELRDLIAVTPRMQLPTQQEDSAFDTASGQLRASGWGRTSENGAISQILLEVAVPSVPVPLCKQLLEPTLPIPDKTVCAGEYGKDTCRGDSGGPLFRRIPGSSAQAVQFGITSFGSGCGQRDKPGVYTRVAAYADWIRKTMGALTCTSELAVAGRC
jgi:secreted trypsin-like serine protease